MSRFLVAGGSGAIGRAICRHLAEQGHNLLIHYHTNLEAAEEAAAFAKSMGVDVDIMSGNFSSREGVVAFAQQCGDLCGFVYSVGPHLKAPLMGTSWEESHHLMQTNFFAAWQLADALLPTIVECRGSIVLLGLAGIDQLRCDKRAPAYRVAKLALWGWMRSFAREVAPRGVRINMVSPGQVETSIELESEWGRLPMGRPAKATEIATVVGSLISNQFSYVTGQNIEVSGGYAL